jgi:hypothetical protein
VPAFEKEMRELLSDPKQIKKFKKKLGEMLEQGDPTAWGLVLKRAWPEPAKGIDLGGQVDGKVTLGWKEPAKPAKKKATRKKVAGKKA